MSEPAYESLPYRRLRFSTRLPMDRRYTREHYWLLEDSPGTWRVGFTAFAIRQLGDLVECQFAVTRSAPVTLGQEIGSIEGFKAVTSICSVVQGEFVESGDVLRTDIITVETDPYDRGWLYRVRGRPDPATVDVYGYVSVLDAALDELRRSRRVAGERDDES